MQSSSHHPLPVRLSVGLSLLAVALVASGPAGAVPFELSLDAGQSGAVPDSGSPETLSGTLEVDVGALPIVAPGTPFDLVDLTITSSGGTDISLDPAMATPGLGVLYPDGSFLIPSLFLRLADGEVLDLTVPDVTGQVGFGSGGTTVESLTSTFEIDAGPPEGLISVTVTTLPEPGGGIQLAVGIAGLAGLAYARRGAREGLR